MTAEEVDTKALEVGSSNIVSVKPLLANGRATDKRS